MSVSLVVIRLELADQSDSPQGFQYCAGEFHSFTVNLHNGHLLCFTVALNDGYIHISSIMVGCIQKY